MVFAYIRVSKQEQNVDRQIENILNYRQNIDEKNIYVDRKSGKSMERREYIKLKEHLKEGDEIIIHELDRLGRNKNEIKDELIYYKQLKIIVRILNMPTTLLEFTENQSWVFDMVNNIMIEVFATIAQNERETIIKRTKEGIEAAKKRGVVMGRPKTPISTINAVKTLFKQEMAAGEIADVLQISKGTVYNILRNKYNTYN